MSLFAAIVLLGGILLAIAASCGYIHTAAYSSAAVTNAAPVPLPGVLDPVLTLAPAGGGFQFQNPYQLISVCTVSPSVKLCYITSPTLRQYNQIQTRPINVAQEPITPMNLDWQLPAGLWLPQLEPVQPVITVTAAGPETAYVILTFRDAVPNPIPQQAMGRQGAGGYGPSNPYVPGVFRVHGTLGAGPAVPSAWTLLPLTLDQTLPTGLYGVIGMEFVSATGIAARIVYPIGNSMYQSTLRPGVPATNGFGGLTDWHLHDRLMGSLGTFLSTSPPNIEVLCFAADAAFDVWFDLVPLGNNMSVQSA